MHDPIANSDLENPVLNLNALRRWQISTSCCGKGRLRGTVKLSPISPQIKILSDSACKGAKYLHHSKNAARIFAARTKKMSWVDYIITREAAKSGEAFFFPGVDCPRSQRSQKITPRDYEKLSLAA